MPQRVILLAASVVLVLVLAAPAGATTLPSGFQETTIQTGVDSGTSTALASDGRRFYNEGGTVWALVPGQSAPVRIYNTPGFLFNLTVDADFASNGYLYLLYIRGPSGDQNGRLSRIRVLPDNTVVGGETILLGSFTGQCPTPRNDLDCMPLPAPENHAVGTVISDPRDGTLWVSNGDNATPGRVDPAAFNAQDPNSLSGKILHVDRNGRGLAGHAYCPTDADLTHNCTKVHATGQRNAYRFNLRPADGVPITGDVGWESREEINVIRKAKNYGWPCYEGTLRTPGYRDDMRCGALYAREGTADAAVPPVYEYDHVVGRSVIGGPVVVSSAWPAEYQGDILFGDYVKGFIKRLRLNASDQLVSVTNFATNWGPGVDLKFDPNGDLYTVTFQEGGAIRRIRPIATGANRAPNALATADKTSGPTPLAVAFKGDGSSDPDNDPLTYEWDFGDGTAHSTQANPSHNYTGAGSFTATLTVRDGRGGSDTDTLTVTPGSSPPTVTIEAPASFRGGTPITLRGSANDPDEGDLPGSALEWNVVLHHNDHDHPLITAQTGAETGFTALDDHDADSHYVVRLSARDSTGVTTSKTVTILPETSRLTLASSPTGAPITYAGGQYTAPLSKPSLIGLRTSISAVQEFIKDGRRWGYASWSDGGARLHDITVPATDSTITATYTDLGPAAEVEKVATGASASSTNLGLVAGNAVDRNTSTRWSSATGVDGQWWQADLGAVKKVSKVGLDWYNNYYATRYKIAVSTNGTTFTEVADVTNAATGRKDTSFPPVDARYVRVTGVTRFTASNGISLREAFVYGPGDGGGDPPPPPPPPPPGDTELAARKPATASASRDGMPPANGNDRSTSTRWSSPLGSDGWWQVDLGSPQTVARVGIDWYNAYYATRYTIAVSTDGFTFTTVADVSNAATGLRETSFTPVTARFVRITALGRATASNGVSFKEAFVYGSGGGGTDPPPPPPPPPGGGTNLALGKAATASTSSLGNEAPKGNDGLSSTRWRPKGPDTAPWWQVDLGAATSVSRVVVEWTGDYASSYRIVTSTDGITWSPAASVTNPGAGNRETTFAARSARYVRVEAMVRGTAANVAFWEARVYAS